MSIKSMAIESDEALQCILTGKNEDAYRLVQDIKDELTHLAMLVDNEYDRLGIKN